MTQMTIVSVFVFIVGAVVGSFLNVCIYRIPRDESIVFPASHCPACGAGIRPFDNIPLLSYLVLRGKCRACGNRISWQYPAVELISALLTLLLFLKLHFSPTFFVLFLFCMALVVITFIDLEHQIIPDRISLSGIVLGFASSFILPWLSWKSSLIGIIAGGGSLLLVAYGYQLLTKKEGMGGGDIKLLAMMGAFLGWRAIPFIIFTSSLFGSIVGVSLMLARKKDSQLPIPFGPFLAFGAVLYIFYGGRLIQWYFSLGGSIGG
ncbi:MAG TPA: prepilin peptidase [Geobacteraceae bacterium]|nr:prepilin peptidase [Geobacteraceae bacterium]